MQNESVPWEVTFEVFKCSVREMRWCLISGTEHLNSSGIISHGTDSFRIKLITPSHPIPKISTHVTIFWESYLKDRVCENNPQTSEDIIRSEIRWIPQETPNGVVDNFKVRVAAVLSYSSVVHGTNIALPKKYSKTLFTLEWFLSKYFYKLPVYVEKKSWRCPYFCKSYHQRKIGAFLWATLFYVSLLC